MALSNAERQARYRQRLRKAAAGENLAEQVSAAIDDAFQAAWDTAKRNGICDFDDYKNVREYREMCARGNPRNVPHELLQTFTAYAGKDATEAENAALERAISLINAAMLRNDAR